MVRGRLIRPTSRRASLPGMDARALHTVNQVWAWVAEMLAGLAALPGFARGLMPGSVWAGR
ncbi:MAG: hypothetical protein AAFX02_03330 [Pseudomonadota bacterium]